MENEPQQRMLTEREYALYLAAKNARRDKIFKTMSAVSKTLTQEGITAGAEVFPGWKDVNCYFPYHTNPGNTVLHIRLSPVEDDKRKLTVTMRELNSEIMVDERKRVSIGAESQSQIRIVLEPTLIPNRSSSVIKLLKKELSKPEYL